MLPLAPVRGALSAAYYCCPARDAPSKGTHFCMSTASSSRSRNTIAPIVLHNGTTQIQAVWPGGIGCFLSDGASTLEMRSPNPNSSAWIEVGSDTTLGAAGGGVFYLPSGTILRANGGAYAIVKQVD